MKTETMMRAYLVADVRLSACPVPSRRLRQKAHFKRRLWLRLWPKDDKYRDWPGRKPSKFCPECGGSKVVRLVSHETGWPVGPPGVCSNRFHGEGVFFAKRETHD